MPTRIRERWFKIGNGFQFLITKALSEAKVSAEEFQTCWKKVQPTIPEEELLRLFKKAFDSRNNIPGRVDFINDILRQYQDMGEPVCDCVACLSSVSVCCIGLLLSQCAISCVLMALTDWTMTVKAGRMFRSLHKKDADVVVEGEKKVEPSSHVPSPLPPTTASAIIQPVCAKPSQHDQNYCVMDEMSTRGACMHETNAVWRFRSDAVQKSVGENGVLTLPSTQKPAPRYLDVLEPFVTSHA